MQFQIRECDDSCQPPARLSYPPVVVEEQVHTLLCGFGTVKFGLEHNNVFGVVAFLLTREIQQLSGVVFVRMKNSTTGCI